MTLMYKVWDKQESINGVEAGKVLASRPELQNAEVILVHNETNHVFNIEMLEILRTALGFSAENTVDEIMTTYISNMQTPVVGNYQPSLDEYKQIKIAELDIAYKNALNGSFQSLGYTFGYDKEAQENFTKVTSIFALKPDKVDTLWNTKSHGIILLTREQYLQVTQDAEDHEWYELGKLWNYAHRVEIAQSYEEVDAVIWE